jgi:hypothetical protein
MRNDPNMRTVNVDWGERVPKLHFVLDQERLQLIGLWTAARIRVKNPVRAQAPQEFPFSSRLNS